MLPEDKLLSNIITVIVQPAIGLLFLVALVFFLWGVYQYISKGNDPEQHKEGAKAMLFGVIGIAVMLGVNGIISFVVHTLGVDEKPKIEFPENLQIGR